MPDVDPMSFLPWDPHETRWGPAPAGGEVCPEDTCYLEMNIDISPNFWLFHLGNLSDSKIPLSFSSFHYLTFSLALFSIPIFLWSTCLSLSSRLISYQVFEQPILLIWSWLICPLARFADMSFHPKKPSVCLKSDLTQTWGWVRSERTQTSSFVIVP